MSFVISSVLPFPNIAWWSAAMQATEVVWDTSEYFEKMSFRNRYVLAGGNGLIKLSIPLAKGRDQKTRMCDVSISNDTPWQRQHWRTLVSAYSRSPFFEHYAPHLERFYSKPYESLEVFSLESIHWLKEQCGISFAEHKAAAYVNGGNGELLDIRPMRTRQAAPGGMASFPGYYQLFEERHGFIANLSLLDLLFAEGPATASWLRINGGAVKDWVNSSGAIGIAFPY
ncbi:MAG: hypothetical protein EOP49_05380 [Sphingobacteriales bacterium]|nr:MAG: hypothetical protein EOP49_05380 [Sphingobacteriales bacterium]